MCVCVCVCWGVGWGWGGGGGGCRVWGGGEEGHLKWTRGEEVSGSCCNLHKATHFLISSTTFIPNSSTSVNIATGHSLLGV